MNYWKDILWGLYIALSLCSIINLRNWIVLELIYCGWRTEANFYESAMVKAN